MERGGKDSKDKVCYTCGHSGFLAFGATCSRCKVLFQHTYCMRFVCLKVPEEWCCEECVPNAESVSNRSTWVNQEETTKIVGPRRTKQEMQQFYHKVSSRNVTGKVKLIPNEEVISLSSCKRHRANLCVPWRSGNCADFKTPHIPTKTLKPTFPSSVAQVTSSRPRKLPAYSDMGITSLKPGQKTKQDNMERGTETSAQVCMTKPAKFNPSSMIQSSSSVTRLNEVKCNADSLHANDGSIQMADIGKEIKASLKPQDECIFIKKEPANASVPYKGVRAPQIKTEANALPSSKRFLPQKLVVSSDEKYHALEECWRGEFEVRDFVQFHGTVHAHLSCQVSPKVYDISKQIPGTLEFKLLPRESVWPKIFKLGRPTKDDVALYFHCQIERHKEKYAHFVQQIALHDYALQGCVADIELLLFTSAQLRIDSQDFGGCIYLWSVFRHVKQKNASHGEEKYVSCSTSTPVHLTNEKSKIPHVDSSLEGNKKVNIEHGSAMDVGMEIDMVGGCPVGKIDVPIKLEDGGLLKPIRRPPVSFSLEKPNCSEILDSPPGFPFPRYKPSNPTHR